LELLGLLLSHPLPDPEGGKTKVSSSIMPLTDDRVEMCMSAI
jgi:hypothetical protein